MRTTIYLATADGLPVITGSDGNWQATVRLEGKPVQSVAADLSRGIEAMYESAMTFTVLQPAIFMQNVAGYWAAVIEQDRFSLPYSVYAKDAYVDYRDVAEAAALALTGYMLDNGTFELCATGMMNRMEIASMMSEVLGRNVGAGVVPFEEYTHNGAPFRRTAQGWTETYVLLL